MGGAGVEEEKRPWQREGEAKGREKWRKWCQDLAPSSSVRGRSNTWGLVTQAQFQALPRPTRVKSVSSEEPQAIPAHSGVWEVLSVVGSLMRGERNFWACPYFTWVSPDTRRNLFEHHVLLWNGGNNTITGLLWGFSGFPKSHFGEDLSTESSTFITFLFLNAWWSFLSSRFNKYFVLENCFSY